MSGCWGCCFALRSRRPWSRPDRSFWTTISPSTGRSTHLWEIANGRDRTGRNGPSSRPAFGRRQKTRRKIARHLRLGRAGRRSVGRGRPDSGVGPQGARRRPGRAHAKERLSSAQLRRTRRSVDASSPQRPRRKASHPMRRPAFSSDRAIFGKAGRSGYGKPGEGVKPESGSGAGRMFQEGKGSAGEGSAATAGDVGTGCAPDGAAAANARAAANAARKIRAKPALSVMPKLRAARSESRHGSSRCRSLRRGAPPDGSGGNSSARTDASRP